MKQEYYIYGARFVVDFVTKQMRVFEYNKQPLAVHIYGAHDKSPDYEQLYQYPGLATSLKLGKINAGTTLQMLEWENSKNGGNLIKIVKRIVDNKSYFAHHHYGKHYVYGQIPAVIVKPPAKIKTLTKKFSCSTASNSSQRKVCCPPPVPPVKMFESTSSSGSSSSSSTLSATSFTSTLTPPPAAASTAPSLELSTEAVKYFVGAPVFDGNNRLVSFITDTFINETNKEVILPITCETYRVQGMFSLDGSIKLYDYLTEIDMSHNENINIHVKYDKKHVSIYVVYKSKIISFVHLHSVFAGNLLIY